jgi:hypothetical protein
MNVKEVPTQTGWVNVSDKANWSARHDLDLSCV